MLRLSVIVEGVETEKQLKFLQAQGCDCAQAYYMSKPLPFSELQQFLKK
ncbi:EAL domain-containing protein [Anoxybacteroides tepidamans]|nr:EAL domain-containing protein [Anoxybacillus tepidamans]